MGSALEEGSNNLFPSSKSLMSPSLAILVPGMFQNSHVTVLSEHAPGLCLYPNALQGQQALGQSLSLVPGTW